MNADEFMHAAVAEAQGGASEGGIPIGSVLVHRGRIIGRGHNRRVQRGSVVLHGEMDAIENAGRQPAAVYRACILYTTLSPCSMCTGAILLYGIGSVVIGENQTFLGAEDLLRSVQWGRHEDLDAAMRIDARHRSLALDLRYFAAVSIKGNPRLLPRDHGRHS